MGKVVKSLAIGAAIFFGLAPLAGAASILLGAKFLATTATVIGAVKAVGVAVALSGVASALLMPKIPKAQLSRLNATLDPIASRKIVFGETAMATDVRYYEPSGTDQEYVDYIIAVAAHEVESIDEIWFEDRMAWSAAGGVQSAYTGYLTVNVRTVGTSANYITINSGTKWGEGETLTGCAYVHIRLKRTGNTKKAESPVVSGLPGRVTIRGKGAKLYDPRLDSTVTGGSGSHRADDQTTWGTASGRDNPALQLLYFMLGYKINGKLSVGAGIPPNRIDLESFITAANVCDESITLAAGGTQPRYLTAGVVGDDDDRMAVIESLLICMNGTLRDSGGKLSLVVIKNDLASPVLNFVDQDVLGEFNWNQTRSLSDSFNVIRGRYTDPSDSSLYQLTDYPSVSIDSPDGIERSKTLDLAFVQEGRRAQRIAKQMLQRAQYRGIFSASFSAKALGVQIGDVVTMSFETLGWSNKLFRVVSQTIRNNGIIDLSMIEENAAIYAWDAEEAPVVTPTEPTVYDPLNSPFILAASEAGETANWSQLIDDNGGLPDDNATRNVVTYSATEPLSPVDGDLWVDTSGFYAVFKLRSGGTWQTGANALTAYNNLTGTPVSLADINTTESSKLSGIENDADRTRILTGQSNVVIRCDSLGTPLSGQLPRDIAFKLYEKGVDVTSSASWSVTTVAGTITRTIGSSTGVLNITALSTSDAKLLVSASYNSVTTNFECEVVKELAAPASIGGNAAYDTTLTSISSTSHTVVSNELIINAIGSGNVDVSLYTDFAAVAESPAGTHHIYVQAEEWNGSAWNTIHSEVISSVANTVFFDGIWFSDPGFASFTVNLTGRTVGNQYKYRLKARLDSGSRTQNFSNSNFQVVAS